MSHWENLWSKEYSIAIDHEFNKGQKPTEGDNLRRFKGDGIDRVTWHIKHTVGRDGRR